MADVRIINGTSCVMRAGCPWRLLPSDLPPWKTIYRCFAAFRDEARCEKINHALVMMGRERAGRGASPSGAILDSQSVKTTEAGYAGQKAAEATAIAVEIAHKTPIK